ncbi:phosphotriesterase family protein [Streptosporangium nondiastaticum]|uniref:phosphotriesterase family protein n=1 Tax=Streptosporangium nondiastaticum TaxID=35764 RepID=UPI001CB8EA4C|nr:aryldialkylphosphatase [Streptosporangium nondiastaticum]
MSGVRGPVLPHEHLALDLRRHGGRDAVLDDRHTGLISAELSALRELFGLALVVDQTCRGMGRDADALRRISAATGVAVVASTGWYYGPFLPPEVQHARVDDLVGALVRDVEEGIGPARVRPGFTRVRPGLIGEVGSSGDRPGALERKTLTAAARAAVLTGLPVATHARLGRGGPAQLALLTAQGLAPDRIAIGHQDLLDAPAVHRRLAREGAYVAFDTIGKDSYQSDTVRLRLLLALLDAGHADRVLLSCDVSRHAYLSGHGGTGYGHLFRTFLPMARAAGIGDDLLDLMTRRNPLRFLTGTAPPNRPAGPPNPRATA